MYKSALT